MSPTLEKATNRLEHTINRQITASRARAAAENARSSTLRGRDYTGAYNTNTYYADTAKILFGPNPRLTELLLNVSLRAVNNQFGHDAGNAYLKGVCDHIFSYAKESGVAISIYRDGPNFTIRFNQNLGTGTVQAFMQGLTTHFSGIRQMNLGGNVTYLPQEGVRVNLAAYSYDQDRDNPAAVGDPSRKLTPADVRRVNRFWTGKVNEGGGASYAKVANISAEEARALDINLRIEGSIKPHRAVDAWPKEMAYLRSLVRKELQLGGLRFSDHQLNEAVRAKYIEPDSGLLNKKAYDALAAKIVADSRKSGKPASVGFFDGNKFAAFPKSFNLLGDQMIDVVIQKRIAEAAGEVFGKYGIVLVRYGTGSEEFGLIGAVNEGTMGKALQEFQEKLAEPLFFKASIAELRQSEQGRQYLSEQGISDSADPSEKVQVNLSVLRRGENGKFKGLSITGAYGPLQDNSARSPEEVAAENYRVMDDRADKLKGANPERRGMIERVANEPAPIAAEATPQNIGFTARIPRQFAGKMAGAGALGFAVELPFALYKHGFSMEALKDSGDAALSWAKFGFVKTTSASSFVFSAGKANTFATALISLRDVSGASPEQRGMVLIGSGATMTGFSGVSMLAGRISNALPIPAWSKWLINFGGGIAGARLAGTAFERSLENRTVQRVVNHKATKAVADVAAYASPGGTSLYLGKVTADAVTWLGLGRTAASFVLRGGVASAAVGTFFYGTDATYQAFSHGRYQAGGLGGFAKNGTYTVRAPHEEMPRTYNSIVSNYPFHRDDPLMFQMAVLLRKQGYLPDFPGSVDETELAEIRNLLGQVNTSDPKDSFTKYHESLEGKKTRQIFGHELRLAREKFVAYAQAAGYKIDSFDATAAQLLLSGTLSRRK